MAMSGLVHLQEHLYALPSPSQTDVRSKSMDKADVLPEELQNPVPSTSALPTATENHGIIDERMNMPMDTMQTTAEAVTFFDEPFDSVNGSPGQGKGKLRCAVKANSDHIEFWERALRILQNITFIDENSKLAKRFLQPRQVRVPCLEGWITTLNSFLGLSKFLFTEHKVEYFYTKFLNQDPLENFFGRIRALNYRNVNPDANTFIYSFKSLVLSNIIAPQSKVMNCEDDDGDTIIKLLFYLFIILRITKHNLNTMLHKTTISLTVVSVESFQSLLYSFLIKYS
ncbi:uncharacterized protein LOC125235954 [Leguminivora glycinivorella]|uniref:uncharacterized protein LOC125235954 n=1 Tax=Leguminivora glycinivorella TaxID=1035111 RepID=UPI00200FAFFD|nr:uncharacterized protein LOC125235954 [Leguminivora glycinivorella]